MSFSKRDIRNKISDIVGEAPFILLSRAKWLIERDKSLYSRMEKFKDIHKDERCFIIGNGPSIKQTDLKKLEHEYTFGLNRVYIMFKELGFSTTYFVCINKNVTEQFADDINCLSMPKFISHRALFGINEDENTFRLRSESGPYFSRDVVRDGVWEGSTVTYVAIQIAFYMGFKEVILIGVDHNFKSKGDPHKLISETSKDENHFHPNYFGPGIRWQLPDLETSERAYSLAKAYFDKQSRSIKNATIGGRLEIFEKIDYQDLFANGT